MAGKKLVIIVMAGLGVISFAVSFTLSTLLGGPPQPASAGQSDKPQQAGALGQLPGIGSASVLPKAKQLDELIKEVRLRIDEYRRREKQLEKREKRLHLAEELLKNQAKELEALRVELVAPLTGLKEIKEELDQTRILISRQEEANLKRTAGVYEKMDSASGSAILVQMCANKQETDAVKILRYMSERAAAKVLAEMPDKSLAAKLSEMMKRVQPQE